MSTLSRKKISICIPVYNESKNILTAVTSVETLFKQITQYDLEIIITDNCSSDETWQVVQELLRARPSYRAYRFSRNFGYQNSVFAGIFMASGDAVIELDADLEDPPEVIKQFIENWENNYQVVYGIRRTRHMSFHRQILFNLFYRLINYLSEVKIPINAGDFRLLDRKVVEILKLLPERNLYIRGLISFLGFRQIGVIYDRNPRVSGKSKFKFFQYVVLAIDAVTSFSKLPLRLIGTIGGILFFMSLCLSSWYLIGYFFSDTRQVQGFTTLVILVVMMNSINFIFIGILGEYLARVFDDAKFRPRVIVQDSINDSNAPSVL